MSYILHTVITFTTPDYYRRASHVKLVQLDVGIIIYDWFNGSN
jgi:hypothetical protein